MTAQRPARILHTPTNTGNQAFTLSRAERRLGFESDVVDFFPAYLKYGADETYDLGSKNRAGKAMTVSRFLAHAARRYDVFHFNFGLPLFPVQVGDHFFTELPLLRRLGKKIVVTWQGCDARPQDECFCTNESCRTDSPRRGPRAQSLLKHADRGFYLNPDLGKHLPGAQFLPYASVDVGAIQPVPAIARSEVVIAHAPTNREVKGTDAVVAAFQSVRDRGANVRLDLVENVPHEEAVRRLADADILVDQLRLGWYGGVAVEAMAIGRPVVCFIGRDNPFGTRLPVVNATDASLADALTRLVSDVELRQRLGRESREFVLAEHDPVKLARRVYEGLVPLPITHQSASRPHDPPRR